MVQILNHTYNHHYTPLTFTGIVLLTVLTPMLSIHTLIDDACTTVMIRPDLADTLRLRRVVLPKPIEFSLAMDSGEVKMFGLQETVCLKLYSVGHGWASKTV